MKNSFINESELKNKLSQIYEEEQLRYLNKKWEKLSGADRTFVIESLKSIYPEKSFVDVFADLPINIWLLAFKSVLKEVLDTTEPSTNNFKLVPLLTAAIWYQVLAVR